MRVPSATTTEREKKLGRELESTADNWRWKFNLPQKPNYDNVYYYRKSKKIFNAPCYDLDMDKPPDSHKGEFLQVKNVLHQTEYRLKHAQEEARNKKQNLAQQWKELEDKESELRHNFIQFNKFLSRNTNKRSRAEQKFQEMNALKVECTEKILQMKNQFGDIREFVEKLKKMVFTHQIYEDFLNSVVSTGSFGTIPHVINRYTLLEETKQSVGKQMEETSEEYHTTRLIYSRLLATSEITFLSLCNELSEMRRRYDDAKNRTNAWEMVINDICNKYDGVARNISWSRMALGHMFDMAFFRVRRRRRWLVKKKKDDLGKMLRINETLKALEGIEWQLRKLYGQKDVSTSMEIEPRVLQVKERSRSSKPAVSRVGSVMSRWKGRKKTVQLSGEEFEPEAGDLAAFLKVAAEGEKQEDNIYPIKLGREKWRMSKVKDFQELYTKALLAIQEEKLQENTKELKYGSPADQSNTSLPHLKSHRAKWTAAAVVQKIAKDVHTHAHPPTPVTTALLTASSDSAVTVLEDRYDSEFLEDVNSDVVGKRLQLKKLIERKFAVMQREPHEKEKFALPTIPSGYLSKEKDSWKRKKPESVKSVAENLPTINSKTGRKITEKYK